MGYHMAGSLSHAVVFMFKYMHVLSDVLHIDKLRYICIADYDSEWWSESNLHLVVQHI